MTLLENLYDGDHHCLKHKKEKGDCSSKLLKKSLHKLTAPTAPKDKRSRFVFYRSAFLALLFSTGNSNLVLAGQ